MQVSHFWWWAIRCSPPLIASSSWGASTCFTSIMLSRTRSILSIFPFGEPFDSSYYSSFFIGDADHLSYVAFLISGVSCSMWTFDMWWTSQNAQEIHFNWTLYEVKNNLIMLNWSLLSIQLLFPSKSYSNSGHNLIMVIYRVHG